MSVRRLVPALVASVAVSTTAAPAQSPERATVRGVVFDSIAQEPLPDAAVFLWQTPHRAVSDAEGRFVIEDVTPGDYSVLFFHTLLGEMGASVGPRPVTLAAGDDLDIRLATPSMFTLVASECLLEERAPNTATVAGWVGDGETGTVMPGAHVTLAWTGAEGGPPHNISMRADAGGWFRTCEAPSDVPIGATAYFLDRQGHRQEFVVPENGSAEVDLLLYRLHPAEVRGRLVDAATDRPVADADVWLGGTSLRTMSRGDGSFEFAQVPAGTYSLHVEHLRYGAKRDTLEVPSGQRLNVEMRIDERPIEIAPLTVEVEAQRVEQRAMGGFMITRAEIDKVRDRVRDVADLIQTQHLAGVIVQRRTDGSLCVGYAPGQVRMLGKECESMIVYINNVRANSDMLALRIPPEAIERIIVYRPVEAGNLFGPGAANGVMTIFTRNHR